MTAAQVTIVKNVLRPGAQASLAFSPPSGNPGSTDYVLRYEFGSLSGQIVRNPNYNAYSWTIPSTFSDEMEGKNVMDGTVFLDTFANNVLVGTTEVGFTIAKSAILVPELSAYNLEVGQTVTITITRSSFMSSTRNFTYKFGDATGDLSVAYDNINDTTGTRDWTIPLSIAKGIPDATSGYLEIHCDTYSSFSESIVGGVTLRVLLRIPNNEQTKPKIEITTQAVSTLNPDFDGIYIRGKTQVQVSMQASSDCSEIETMSISADSVQVSGGQATFDLNTDMLLIRGDATDKRGYTAFAYKAVSAKAYSNPSVIPVSGETKIICARCLSDGTLSRKGEFLLIQAGRRYTSITNGTKQLNKCALRYRFKAASAGDYSEWAPLLSENASGNEYKGVVSGVVLNAKTGYTVQVGVLDTLGEYHNVTVPIPASGVPFHVGQGNRNVSVGGFCDYSRTDVFDVYFTQYFFTGAKAQTVFEDGNWTAGAELGAAIADADVTGIGTYNLLIAVSGGNPVLLVKAGDKIAGGDIQIQYAMTDGVDYLTLQSGGPITALYKLL